MIIVKDNFFENFDTIEKYFKDIPLYSGNEWNKKFGGNSGGGYWPGSRSQHLYETNPFLWALIAKEIKEKYSDIISWPPEIIDAYTHLRLNEDNEKDFPHQDLDTRYTLMVYLSDTNLQSGTCFYQKVNQEYLDHEPITTVNFVKNMAVLFSGSLYHKSKRNYGTNINNGRLTLNCFIS